MPPVDSHDFGVMVSNIHKACNGMLRVTEMTCKSRDANFGLYKRAREAEAELEATGKRLRAERDKECITQDAKLLKEQADGALRILDEKLLQAEEDARFYKRHKERAQRMETDAADKYQELVEKARTQTEKILESAQKYADGLRQSSDRMHEEAIETQKRADAKYKSTLDEAHRKAAVIIQRAEADAEKAINAAKRLCQANNAGFSYEL
jgi:hypothetical protein